MPGFYKYSNNPYMQCKYDLKSLEKVGRTLLAGAD